MKEIWKNILEYEGYYRISNLGRVKSLERKTRHNHIIKEHILRLRSNGRYYFVDLYKNNTSKHFYVHKLVLNAFVVNSANKLEANHKDGDKNNNSVYNLEWATPKENCCHRDTILGKHSRGEDNLNSKLTSMNVRSIRNLLNTTKLSQRKIAKMFNVSQANISLINTSKNWRG